MEVLWLKDTLKASEVLKTLGRKAFYQRPGISLRRGGSK
jgi:hypothetical protein